MVKICSKTLNLFPFLFTSVLKSPGIISPYWRQGRALIFQSQAFWKNHLINKIKFQMKRSKKSAGLCESLEFSLRIKSNFEGFDRFQSGGWNLVAIDLLEIWGIYSNCGLLRCKIPFCVISRPQFDKLSKILIQFTKLPYPEWFQAETSSLWKVSFIKWQDPIGNSGLI